MCVLCVWKLLQVPRKDAVSALSICLDSYLDGASGDVDFSICLSFYVVPQRHRSTSSLQVMTNLVHASPVEMEQTFLVKDLGCKHQIS